MKAWFAPKYYTRWLLGIVILAAILRLWGLSFGLPNLSRPDENSVSKFDVQLIMQSFFVGQPTLDPMFFHYPSLYLYLILILDTGFYLIGHMFGVFTDGNAFIGQYLNDWSLFHLIQRITSSIFGIATIPALIGLTGAVTRSRWTGLLAGFLMAVTYLHVRDSHFGVTDTTCVFFAVISLWLSVAYWRSGRLKPFYLAIMFAGLAATTKYPLGVALGAPFLAYWFVQKRAGYSLRQLFEQPVLFRPILLGVVLFLVTFFGCSPFILLDPVKFWEDVGAQGGAILSTNFSNLPPGGIYHLTFSLWYGMGPLLAATGYMALFWMVWRSRNQPQGWEVHILLLSYLLAYFAINATTRYVYVRYAIPMIPILCLYAAWLVVTVSRQLQTRVKIHVKAISLLIALLISAQSIAASIQINRLFTQTDTRSLARTWLLSRIKPPDAVGVGMVFTHIDLPFNFNKYFLSPPQGVNEAGNPNLNYIYRPEATVKMKYTDRHERGVSTYTDVATLRKLGIHYFTISIAPMPFYALPKEEIARIETHPELKLLAQYKPFGNNPSRPVEDYDQVDGFFIPFRNFESMERPGPEIRIYEVMASPQYRK